jgi:hypothetical protein
MNTSKREGPRIGPLGTPKLLPMVQRENQKREPEIVCHFISLRTKYSPQ